MGSYRIVQNIQGPKLSWLGHHVSICGKTFVFASKQCPRVPKYFEISRKTFAVEAKTVRTMNVLALERFVLAQHTAVRSKEPRSRERG